MTTFLDGVPAEDPTACHPLHSERTETRNEQQLLRHAGSAAPRLSVASTLAYIYEDIVLVYISPNKRSFRGPGGVVRDLGIQGRQNLCAGSGLGGLQWSPDGLTVGALNAESPQFS